MAVLIKKPLNLDPLLQGEMQGKAIFSELTKPYHSFPCEECRILRTVPSNF